MHGTRACEAQATSHVCRCAASIAVQCVPEENLHEGDPSARCAAACNAEATTLGHSRSISRNSRSSASLPAIARPHLTKSNCKRVRSSMFVACPH